jgi:hypothetical protein
VIDYYPTHAEADSGTFAQTAAKAALAKVDLSVCRPDGREAGIGHVSIWFAPTGTVTCLQVDRCPFEETSVRACVEKRFMGVRVPVFGGSVQGVGYTFHL